MRRPKSLRTITEWSKEGKNSSINGGQDQGESRQREEGMCGARPDGGPAGAGRGEAWEELWSGRCREEQDGQPPRPARSGAPKGGSETSREPREKPSPRKSARFPSGQDRETDTWRRAPEGTVARPGDGRRAGPDSGPVRGDAEPLRTCVCESLRGGAGAGVPGSA